MKTVLERFRYEYALLKLDDEENTNKSWELMKAWDNHPTDALFGHTDNLSPKQIKAKRIHEDFEKNTKSGFLKKKDYEKLYNLVTNALTTKARCIDEIEDWLIKEIEAIDKPFSLELAEIKTKTKTSCTHKPKKTTIMLNKELNRSKQLNIYPMSKR